MPYAQVSDVQALAPAVKITAQSEPSDGVVQGWIADAERDIDIVIGSMGYAVPVSGPNARSFVRNIVAHHVMAQVLRARPNPGYDPESFQKRADATLAALRDPRNPLTLPSDAVRNAPAQIKEADLTVRVHSNLRDMVRDDDFDARPTRDKVF